MELPEGEYFLHEVEVVGYHDLAGRPGFKMGMQHVKGRWYLHLGHLWHRGWSIMDVTSPNDPRLVWHQEGPPNTWTIQMQVAGGRMITPLEKIDRGWGDDPAAPFEEGFLVWDVTDPEEPARLGHFTTGGNGTHRAFFDGGRLVHLPSVLAGHDGHIYQVADISDPTTPREVGRWWLPGQWRAGGEAGVPVGTGLHAPCVAGDRAYLAYGAAGLVILDVSDPSAPRPVSRLPLSPPFAAEIAAHTAVPLPERGLVMVNSEAIAEGCDEPLGMAGLVDVSDERSPRLMSLFPLPSPPPGAPYRNYCERGGRFGPHNLHQWQGHPDLLRRDDLAFLTYFNAGLRIFDISDARLPREVGYFVPPDPERRVGVLPATLVAQSEDVLVDARGFIYVTDKNHGLHVLRFTG